MLQEQKVMGVETYNIEDMLGFSYRGPMKLSFHEK